MNMLNSRFDRRRSASVSKNARLLAILSALLLGLYGCSSKPDAAMCGRYYSHLSKQQADGHPAILAAVKTAGGREAIITHCMQLTKKQVDCSIKSESISAAKACELKEKSFWDRFF